MSISDDMLKILACPACKGRLKTVNDPEGFVCQPCSLLFKVEDGIPNFLIDEAVSLNDEKSL